MEKYTIGDGIAIDRHRPSPLDDDVQTMDYIQSTTAVSVLSHRIVIPNHADHLSSPPTVNTSSSDYRISNFDHASERDNTVEDDDEVNPMNQAPAVHDDVENENEDDNEQETERAATYDEKMHDEDDDDEDSKIIDELSSYHDKEDDVYDDGDMHYFAIST